uniref:Golgi to ER traffic protein 4 homolog n=1 Tax=Cannabis sativa TaxID=3483 RepID=A0A803P238_CANSA
MSPTRMETRMEGIIGGLKEHLKLHDQSLVVITKQLKILTNGQAPIADELTTIICKAFAVSQTSGWRMTGEASPLSGATEANPDEWTHQADRYFGLQRLSPTEQPEAETTGCRALPREVTRIDSQASVGAERYCFGGAQVAFVLVGMMVTCGAELAVLFVDTLVKARVSYDDETLDRVRKIYNKFPQIPVPQHLADDDDVQQLSEALGAAKTRVDGCSSFLKAAIRWSAEFGAPRNGSPELHVMLAEYIYSESPEVDMTRVSNHFIRGNNPKKFASVLVNFMGKCYPGEDDLAISRAILMYLSSGNLRDANQLIDEIKSQVEDRQLDLPHSDLIQFITFLLQTLQRDALPLFNMLKVKYKSCIDRDPSFKELLDDIAEKFYGVRRRNPLQGMFGDIFKNSGAVPPLSLWFNFSGPPNLLSAGNLRHHRAKKRLSRLLGLNSFPLTTPFGSTLLIPWLGLGHSMEDDD